MAIVDGEGGGEFTPHDEFFEKGTARSFGGVTGMRGERDRMRSNLAEMQIRRQMAGGVEFGCIAAFGILRKALAHKTFQVRKRDSGTAGKMIGLGDRAINWQRIK